MAGDILRISEAQIRILKGLITEQKKDEKTGVTGLTCHDFDSLKRNRVANSTFIENIVYLEKNDLVRIVPSKKLKRKRKRTLYRPNRKPYVITDLGFFMFIKNISKTSLSKTVIDNLNYYLPLIDYNLWHTLEQKIGTMFPSAVFFVAIHRFDIEQVKGKNIRIRVESSLNGRHIINKFDIEKNHLMENLARRFYSGLLKNLTKPSRLFFFWKHNDKDMKPEPKLINELEKKGNQLREDVKYIISNNPKLSKMFKEELSGLDTYLQDSRKELRKEMNFLFAKN